ncbi:MAG TPA: LytR C-terminal domain-containing protein [Solirubrobacteraceae bacterium]|nr:LytR C-terminal domain-containing protein [Solirubrobacteraceae bacterium]
MVWFALSFQDQVEKYGVYVGIAAFFGLALLSVLYFSQARELKRLREWAGRAPERARDLEQRVVAQATATVARRSPQMPAAPGKPAGAIAPARRLAEMPAPQATELAGKAPEEDAAVTNGNVPSPPEADAAPPAAPPAPGAEEAPPTPPDAPAMQEPAAVAAAAEPAAGEETQEHALEETGEHAAGETGEHATDTGERDADTGEHDLEETGEHDLETGEHDPVTDDAPAVAVPRVTPAQRVGVTPRPAPLPLRQANPTATPAGRRPGTPPGRGPAAAPAPQKRSAGTIVLLAGLALLLVGGTAFGLSQVLGGDDGSPPPNTAAPPPAETPGANGSGASVPNEETAVGVLNGTTTNGLASTLADRLQQEGGYARGTTATNTRDQTLQASTVYYADGFRAQARSVAELLGIDAVEPLDEETKALAPDSDVVVLAGADQSTQ